jgi:hypothetical protein
MKSLRDRLICVMLSRVCRLTKPFATRQIKRVTLKSLRVIDMQMEMQHRIDTGRDCANPDAHGCTGNVFARNGVVATAGMAFDWQRNGNCNTAPVLRAGSSCLRGAGRSFASERRVATDLLRPPCHVASAGMP